MTQSGNDACADDWQSRFSTAVFSFGAMLKELHKSNPWPDNPLLPQAMSHLASELWDGYFSQTEIRKAFEDALEDLSLYAAGEDRRR